MRYKKYQQYNEALRLWQEKAQGIEGDAEKPDTLKWYEAQLRYIETIRPRRSRSCNSKDARQRPLFMDA